MTQIAGATLRVNRRMEFEAFDGLPQNIRDIMNMTTLPHSAIQVRALLQATPQSVVVAMLKKRSSALEATRA